MAVIDMVLSDDVCIDKSSDEKASHYNNDSDCKHGKEYRPSNAFCGDHLCIRHVPGEHSQHLIKGSNETGELHNLCAKDEVCK